MSGGSWDLQRTEEGLQAALVRLAECRAKGDLVEIGNGLLALSFLVKWVRSDTDQSPFARSHELALESVGVFRIAKHEEGLVRALVAASALADPVTREPMLAEAESLAAGLSNENLLARVIAAQARALSLSDRNKGAEMHRQALEIYRRTGNRKGQAQCLFGLSIGDGDPEVQRGIALEAADLFRSLGDFTEASRCVSIALMYAERIQPLSEAESLVHQGLQDALDAGNRSLERTFYRKLAEISTAKGKPEEAERYQRWATAIQESQGLTPIERRERDVEIAKMLLDMSIAEGQMDGANMFRDALKRIESTKPTE